MAEQQRDQYPQVRPQDARFPEEATTVRHDDEISLVDLWLALVRQRRWLFGVALAVFLAGSGYALTLPSAQIEFETLIERSTAEDEPLRSAARARAELEHLIIPELRRALREADPDGRRPPEVKISTIEQTGLLRLSSTTRPERLEQVRGLHEAVYEHFAESEQAVFQRTHSELERDLKRAQNELAELAERYAEQRELLRQQLADTQKSLQDLLTERGQLLSQRDALREEEADPGTEAATLAQRQRDLQRDLRENREERETQRADLRGLERDLHELHKQQRSGERELTALIDRLEDRLDRFEEASLIDLATEGETEGSRRNLIIALSAVLGLMLGLFAAFFRQFLEHVREVTGSTSATSPET
ncbi:hypothetical protein CKO15_04395 [Halorhodospira abdelmalekii]|uniref:hypothetical protein n=1 Tax=Halorhodospira abdelmalekii TaxID=421629 RepID=UPI001903BC00|nr:hypothetical protein [Halorhodospira abdelmalekii]MBK1734537.1 hypothetical protein [Halorhodospira abdelmalekii]